MMETGLPPRKRIRVAVNGYGVIGSDDDRHSAGDNRSCALQGRSVHPADKSEVVAPFSTSPRIALISWHSGLSGINRVRELMAEFGPTYENLYEVALWEDMLAAQVNEAFDDRMVDNQAIVEINVPRSKNEQVTRYRAMVFSNGPWPEDNNSSAYERCEEAGHPCGSINRREAIQPFPPERLCGFSFLALVMEMGAAESCRRH